ncbi:MAG TPA: hypothetical protein VII72_01845 [Myxococcota bacterium]|jgi:hypothetical protein
MSFHPLMALLVRGAVEILGPDPTVVELGNQTFTPDDGTLRRILAHPGRAKAIDRAGLETLLGEPKQARRGRTAAYYQSLGFSAYDAIDVNDGYGSLVMDLNRDLRLHYGFDRSFSLVTNNGTGEHVFDQRSIFQNVHALTGVGGVQLHVLPCLDYVNHGFYSFHPNLFHALARANGYRLIALGIGSRLGHAVISRPDAEEPLFAPPLHSCREVDPATILGRVKAERSALLPRLGRFGRRIFRGESPSRGLSSAISQLHRTHGKLVVFAVMRKLADGAFRPPIQGRYADAISDPGIRIDYLPPDAER